MTTKTIEIPLLQETDTAALAAQFATMLERGDSLLLDGPIGAGKSAFSRALIRARFENDRLEVPSPTFTLVQTYTHDDGDIWHCDLYRLTHPDEIFELGLEEAVSDSICLIEWPERLGNGAPADGLRLVFSVRDQGHHVAIHAPANWHTRIERLDV
ncbi:tRNA (adenosine(37)-N6)-threonylcarbamoyltransferase complex ATPase subunit type 1 TsaE [Yoonia sp. SS1-5]|uniref:tRNA threonylcarbamoyladenosine biosynthesis protein TsaE n=1 Tax=Yoonia rhodophyticola TaxID=3137370 RepID=A0AAN0MEM9_9RHOB